MSLARLVALNNATGQDTKESRRLPCQMGRAGILASSDFGTTAGVAFFVMAFFLALAAMSSLPVYARPALRHKQSIPGQHFLRQGEGPYFSGRIQQASRHFHLARSPGSTMRECRTDLAFHGSRQTSCDNAAYDPHVHVVGKKSVPIK